jgi:predicted RNase H-like HicB family nuclease
MKRRYAVIIEGGGQGYSAYLPDLPGCIATGDTVEKVQRLIREALAIHLEGMREDGLPIPEPTSLCEYVEVALPAARTA